MDFLRQALNGMREERRRSIPQRKAQEAAENVLMATYKDNYNNLGIANLEIIMF